MPSKIAIGNLEKSGGILGEADAIKIVQALHGKLKFHLGWPIDIVDHSMATANLKKSEYIPRRPKISIN